MYQIVAGQFEYALGQHVYVVLDSGKYLTKSGGLTSDLSRAAIFFGENRRQEAAKFIKRMEGGCCR